jgi:hypothetical protein
MPVHSFEVFSLELLRNRFCSEGFVVKMFTIRIAISINVRFEEKKRKKKSIFEKNKSDRKTRKSYLPIDRKIRLKSTSLSTTTILRLKFNIRFLPL